MQANDDDGQHTRQLQGFEDVLFENDEDDGDDDGDKKSKASRRSGASRGGKSDVWLQEAGEVGLPTFTCAVLF